MIELFSTEPERPKEPGWPPPGSALAGLVAAWPALFTAIAYLAAGLMDIRFLGFTRHYLVKMMQVEFLVIHAGAMLTAVGLARITPQPKPRRLLTYGFWVLFAMYILMSFSFAWYGPLLFLHATAATFWGIGWGKLAPSLMLALLVRWFVTVIVYVIAIETQHLPREVASWYDEPATHMAGFLYFAALGVLEWAGFFRMSWWKQLEKTDPNDLSKRG
jgi:hypothetical protein